MLSFCFLNVDNKLATPVVAEWHIKRLVKKPRNSIKPKHFGGIGAELPAYNANEDFDESRRGVSKPCQISKMERFAKTVKGFKSLTIFAKCCMLDVWQGSEYTSTYVINSNFFWSFWVSRNIIAQKKPFQKLKNYSL